MTAREFVALALAIHFIASASAARKFGDERIASQRFNEEFLDMFDFLDIFGDDGKKKPAKPSVIGSPAPPTGFKCPPSSSYYGSTPTGPPAIPAPPGYRPPNDGYDFGSPHHHPVNYGAYHKPAYPHYPPMYDTPHGHPYPPPPYPPPLPAYTKPAYQRPTYSKHDTERQHPLYS